MFNFVHHVRILVHDADKMVEYMDRNFGMTPVKVQVYESRGMKNAIYKVGSTNLEFTEPLDANSKMSKFLAEEGPGVYHIAFGVDDVRGAAKELTAKGNTLRGRGWNNPKRGRLFHGEHRPGKRPGLPLSTG